MSAEFQEKQCGSMIIKRHRGIATNDKLEDWMEISHVGRSEVLTRLDRDDLKDLRYLINRVLEDRS